MFTVVKFPESNDYEVVRSEWIKKDQLSFPSKINYHKVLFKVPFDQKKLRSGKNTKLRY